MERTARSIKEETQGDEEMNLKPKLRVLCLTLLALFLIVSNTPLIPLVRAPGTDQVNVSIQVFEDTGTAGDRSDDTKRSFSGFYTATYAQALDSTTTQVATQFTKVGEINKVRVCWEQGFTTSGTAYIRIETDAAGPEPSGTLADADAEISVSASSLPTSGAEWCEYTFPGSVTLSESNWYWIVIKYVPSGSGTIEVRGSYVSTGILPANIPRGGVYAGGWATTTDRAYVAFVIPETGHSLPVYRYVRMDTEWAVAAGTNHMAELFNDVDKVYRIVMQIEPKADQWKWAPDDTGATDYYIRDAGSTPSVADMDTSDSETRPQFIVQQSLGSGTYPDIFLSGNEASEWDGKSSITLTERGAVDTNAEGDGTGKGINCDDGTLNWDDVNDAIAQDNWQVIEFWFKLDDDWTDNDVAELRYWQEAEGGNNDLTGLRYRVKVVQRQIENVDADGPYNVLETLTVTWTNNDAFSSGENYINVEYYDKDLGQFLARHGGLSTTAAGDTYGPIAGAQAGHTIEVYVYTAANPGDGNDSWITRGNPWPATCYVNSGVLEFPVGTTLLLPLAAAVYIIVRRRSASRRKS